MWSADDEDEAMHYHAIEGPEIDGKAARALAATFSAAGLERKVLVAFDGSPAARCALEYAIEEAWHSGMALHVVNVQTALIDNAVTYRSYQGIGAEILRAATAQLERHGIRHTTEVAFGSVAHSIVRSAAMQRCDAIVIGSRDRLAMTNLLSTSVSSRVVRLARVPVTVIKQPGKAAWTPISTPRLAGEMK
jgi:nucleotide-binding universal stress UspA family protein